jgi:hypothetical protein
MRRVLPKFVCVENLHIGNPDTILESNMTVISIDEEGTALLIQRIAGIKKVLAAVTVEFLSQFEIMIKLLSLSVRNCNEADRVS